MNLFWCLRSSTLNVNSQLSQGKYLGCNKWTTYSNRHLNCQQPHNFLLSLGQAEPNLRKQFGLILWFVQDDAMKNKDFIPFISTTFQTTRTVCVKLIHQFISE